MKTMKEDISIEGHVYNTGREWPLIEARMARINHLAMPLTSRFLPPTNSSLKISQLEERGEFNHQYLRVHYGITDANIAAFYTLGKFLYDLGTPVERERAGVILDVFLRLSRSEQARERRVARRLHAEEALEAKRKRLWRRGGGGVLEKGEEGCQQQRRRRELALSEGFEPISEVCFDGTEWVGERLLRMYFSEPVVGAAADDDGSPPTRPVMVSEEGTFGPGFIVRCPPANGTIAGRVGRELINGGAACYTFHCAKGFVPRLGGAERLMLKVVRPVQQQVAQQSDSPRDDRRHSELAKEALLNFNIGDHPNVALIRMIVPLLQRGNTAPVGTLVFSDFADGGTLEFALWGSMGACGARLTEARFRGMLHNLPGREWSTKRRCEALLSLAFQAACGLTHLHRCGIIHGDIRSANMVLCGAYPNQVLKITSLGCLASVGKWNDAGSDELQRRLGADGGGGGGVSGLYAPFLGCTPAYQSPEIRDLRSTLEGIRERGEPDLAMRDNALAAVAESDGCTDDLHAAEKRRSAQESARKDFQNTLRRQQVEARMSDCWAFGVIVLEMFGVPPCGDSALEAFRQFQVRAKQSEASVRGWAPSEVSEWVSRRLEPTIELDTAERRSKFGLSDAFSELVVDGVGLLSLEKSGRELMRALHLERANRRRMRTLELALGRLHRYPGGIMGVRAWDTKRVRSWIECDVVPFIQREEREALDGTAPYEYSAAKPGRRQSDIIEAAQFAKLDAFQDAGNMGAHFEKCGIDGPQLLTLGLKPHLCRELGLEICDTTRPKKFAHAVESKLRGAGGMLEGWGVGATRWWVENSPFFRGLRLRESHSSAHKKAATSAPTVLGALFERLAVDGRQILRLPLNPALLELVGESFTFDLEVNGGDHDGNEEEEDSLTGARPSEPESRAADVAPHLVRAYFIEKLGCAVQAEGERYALPDDLLRLLAATFSPSWSERPPTIAPISAAKGAWQSPLLSQLAPMCAEFVPKPLLNRVDGGAHMGHAKWWSGQPRHDSATMVLGNLALCEAEGRPQEALTLLWNCAFDKGSSTANRDTAWSKILRLVKSPEAAGNLSADQSLAFPNDTHNYVRRVPLAQAQLQGLLGVWPAASQIKSLSLSGQAEITSIDCLSACRHLIWLDISGCLRLRQMEPVALTVAVREGGAVLRPDGERLALCASDSTLDLTGSDIASLPGTLLLADCGPHFNHLDLSHCSNFADLDGIFRLAKKAEEQDRQMKVTLPCGHVVEAASLLEDPGLPPPRYLNLEGEEACVPDLEAIAAHFCDTLVDLNVRNCKHVSSLAPLKCCTAVTALDFGECCHITDLWPLRSMRHLSELRAGGHGMRIKDVTALGLCTSISLLDLSGCRSLTSVAPLRSLTRLTWLALRDCCLVKRVEVLAPCRALVYLDLHDCACSGTEQLRRAQKKINIVGFAGCVVRATGGLDTSDDFSRKVELDLSGNRGLMDVAPLGKCTSLFKLNLAGCPLLSCLRPLGNCTQLGVLDLNECSGVVDISPVVNNCRSLLRLNLSGLTSLRALPPAMGKSLPVLFSLSIEACEALEDIAPLESCVSLRELNMSYCWSIADISPLSSARNLAKLCARDCRRIGDVSCLGCCSALTDLDLCRCHKLNSIDGIRRCTALTRLSLSGCPVRNGLDDIRACCTALVKLDVTRAIPPPGSSGARKRPSPATGARAIVCEKEKQREAEPADDGDEGEESVVRQATSTKAEGQSAVTWWDENRRLLERVKSSMVRKPSTATK